MNLNPFKFAKKLLLKRLLSPLCHSLIKSWSETGSEWHYDDYHLTHKKSNTTLWIGNGRWFFNVVVDRSHSGGNPIGLFERHLLWHEYKLIMKISDKNKAKRLHDELVAKLTSTEIGSVEENTDSVPSAKKPRIRKQA